MTKQSVKLERVSRLNNVEFLQTDPRHRLTQHRFVTMVGESGGAGRYGFDRLMVLDRQSDAVHFYDADEHEMLEEHVMVPKPGEETTFGLLAQACIGVSNEPICPSMKDRRLAAVLFAAHFWTMRCLWGCTACFYLRN